MTKFRGIVRTKSIRNKEDKLKTRGKKVLVMASTTISVDQNYNAY